MNQKPLVSVHMITYNHAQFICQAIDGVLNQRTTFQIEIVIGEDCSTDGTKEIVFKYQQKYPEIIRIVTSEKNVGMSANFVRTLNACKGKYIAFCEGDDYWTDPLKLQKQVDIMESEPDCAVCVHNATILQGSKETLHWPDIKKPKYTLNEVFRNYFIATNSILLRAKWLWRVLPDWFFELPGSAGPIVYYACKHGYLRTINETMSVYRKHAGGVHSSLTQIEQINKGIEGRLLLQREFPNNPGLKKAILNLNCRAIDILTNNGDFEKSKKYWKTYIRPQILGNPVLLKYGIKAYFPHTYLSLIKILNI